MGKEDKETTNFGKDFVKPMRLLENEISSRAAWTQNSILKKRYRVVNKSLNVIFLAFVVVESNHEKWFWMNHSTLYVQLLQIPFHRVAFKMADKQAI